LLAWVTFFRAPLNHLAQKLRLNNAAVIKAHVRMRLLPKNRLNGIAIVKIANSIRLAESSRIIGQGN